MRCAALRHDAEWSVVLHGRAGQCDATQRRTTRGGAVRYAETRGVVMTSEVVRRDANSVLLDAHHIKAAIIAVIAGTETAKADEFSSAFQNVLENGSGLIGGG